MARLKTEIIEKIKKDSVLCGQVADKLGIKFSSLPMILSRNAKSLTQLPVLEVIADKLGTDMKELIDPATILQPTI